MDKYEELLNEIEILKLRVEQLKEENGVLWRVVHAAKASVANPAWAGVCDEDVILERTINEFNAAYQ